MASCSSAPTRRFPIVESAGHTTITALPEQSTYGTTGQLTLYCKSAIPSPLALHADACTILSSAGRFSRIRLGPVAFTDERRTDE